MNDKVISIIVPVYNVEAYLDECVQSIVNQTHKNIEVILVDDGSEDKSSSMCDEWAKKDSRIKVIHQDNQGLSMARNAGIDIARGYYIYFVDSDDYIDYELCSKMVQALEKTGSDIVAVNYYQVDEEGALYAPVHKHPLGILSSHEALYHLIHDNLRTHAWSKMCKRELFTNVRFPEGFYCEDVGTIYKLFAKANSICVLDDKLYYYRQRKGSIMNEWSNKTMFDLYRMKKARYSDLLLLYPDLANDDFKNVALLAKSVYIRSLFGDMDKVYVDEVVSFLNDNKERILKEIDDKDFVFFYRFPKSYRTYRRLRHKIALMVKRK